MTATGLSFGWIGTGRMGYLLASRLLRGGHEVAVYNRSCGSVAAPGARMTLSIGSASSSSRVSAISRKTCSFESKWW